VIVKESVQMFTHIFLFLVRAIGKDSNIVLSVFSECNQYLPEKILIALKR